MRFKDAVIGNYFIDLYGDGVGITKQQIQSIKVISDKIFRDNEEITSSMNYSILHQFLNYIHILSSIVRN